MKRVRGLARRRKQHGLSEAHHVHRTDHDEQFYLGDEFIGSVRISMPPHPAPAWRPRGVISVAGFDTTPGRAALLVLCRVAPASAATVEDAGVRVEWGRRQRDPADSAPLPAAVHTDALSAHRCWRLNEKDAQ